MKKRSFKKRLHVERGHIINLRMMLKKIGKLHGNNGVCVCVCVCAWLCVWVCICTYAHAGNMLLLITIIMIVIIMELLGHDAKADWSCSLVYQLEVITWQTSSQREMVTKVSPGTRDYCNIWVVLYLILCCFPACVMI